MPTQNGLRKMFINNIYFGIPILVALSSAVFSVSNFIRQAMVSFVILCAWQEAGCLISLTEA